MLPFVIIRQDAMSKWLGNPEKNVTPKIDVTEAMLIALVRSLNPDNPSIAELMWHGYFLLSRRYIREMLPLVNLTDDWIGRKLRHLQQVGLLDIRFRGTGRGKLRYVKLSRLYWQEEDRANKKAESHADYTPDGYSHTGCTPDSGGYPPGVHSLGSTLPNHAGSTPDDHIKDQREEPADPQSAGCPEGPPPAAGTEPKPEDELDENGRSPYVGEMMREFKDKLLVGRF